MYLRKLIWINNNDLCIVVVTAIVIVELYNRLISKFKLVPGTLYYGMKSTDLPKINIFLLK